MTHNEEHIIIMLKEYDKLSAQFPPLINAEIAKEMSKKFHVVIKKNINGECLNCEHEPCLCHLTAMTI